MPLPPPARSRRARLLALTLASVLVATAAAAQESEAPTDPGPEPEEEVPELDLRRLQRAAEAGYPGIRAAGARIRAARAQLDEAWVSPFFQSFITTGVSLAPEVTGSPIFSQDGQLPLSNPWQPILAFQIQGVIPLWTFGKLPAVRDAARAGVRAAESDRTRVLSQLRFDVRRAYYGLQLSLDLQQLVSETLPAMEQALTGLEEQLAEGDPEVSDLDRWRLQAALSEVRARAADIARLEAGARAALRTLTGIEEAFTIPECPIEPLPVQLEERPYYEQRAGSDRPEIRQLEAALAARQASVDITSAGFFPDLALAYRFSTTYAPGITDQLNPFIIDNANYTSVSAGLVLRWSLDFWGNAYRLDRERALLDDLRERSREAGRGIRLQVDTVYDRAVAARAQVDAWGEGRRRTRRWFIAALQGRDVGTTETRDLVDAVRAYLTARVSHLQAIHDFDVALAELEQVSGAPVTDQWELPCE